MLSKDKTYTFVNKKPTGLTAKVKFLYWSFGCMNKLQKSAPQGQYRLAQGSALGRSVATRQRPVRAASFKLLRATVLPLQGAVSLVPYNPGRCPGLGDDWPYRPLNTTSETSMNDFLFDFWMILRSNATPQTLNNVTQIYRISQIALRAVPCF
jgi:hypothetical protein